MESQEDPRTSWRELRKASRHLIPIATTAADEIRQLPHGAEVAGKMLEIVGRLDLLIAGGEKACREVRVRELEELLELKSGFLLLAVHELRRPLGLLGGHLSLLQDTTLGSSPGRMVQIAEQVRSSVRDMRRLVAGLEEAARLEDGAHALKRRPCNLYRLAEEAVKAVRLEARAKDITLYRQLPELGAEVTAISADPQMLRTVIINLLSNAIKFAPAHSNVVVTTDVGAEVATIAIRDKGPGIDPAKVEDIFKPWHRGPGERVAGLGLGLYIVRQIAELHGGEVKVESLPGHGATFTIKLPK
jgi:signal transduction histidine kinase